MLLMCVWAVLGAALGTHNICRGILLHNHGEAVILDEYALVKLNVSIIHENENNLRELRVILGKFKREMNNLTPVHVIEGILNSVNEELSVEISGVNHKKRSLLPFVGQALKSMFGVLTEANHR